MFRPNMQRLRTVTHQGTVHGLGFVDEEHFVTGSYDDTARVWHIKSDQKDGIVFRGHGSSDVNDLTVFDCGLVATGGDDNDVKIWNPTTGQIMLNLMVNDLLRF